MFVCTYYKLFCSVYIHFMYFLYIMYFVYIMFWEPQGRWVNVHWVYPLEIKILLLLLLLLINSAILAAITSWPYFDSRLTQRHRRWANWVNIIIVDISYQLGFVTATWGWWLKVRPHQTPRRAASHCAALLKINCTGYHSRGYTASCAAKGKLGKVYLSRRLFISALLCSQSR